MNYLTNDIFVIYDIFNLRTMFIMHNYEIIFPHIPIDIL